MGVTTRLPFGPILANIFLLFYVTKNNWLKRCPKKLKRFVDDIIVFEKPGHLQQFAACTNIQHPNNRYSVKTEKNGALPFADINI